jgi:ERCC4-type nuclease
MTICIDDRIGSNHLAKLITNSEIARLDYGDACFSAVDNKLIGIEIKTIADAVSSMLSGRLVDHQIPGLLQMYDVVYLIIEGYYRCDPKTGIMQWRRGKDWGDIYSGSSRVTWNQFDGWLTSIETLAGIRVRRTTSTSETAMTISSLFTWWQKEEHKTLRVFNTVADAAAVERPNLCRRMAAQLPSIGWQRSSDVAIKFKTVERMVMAGKVEWMEIDGIGNNIADKVWEAMRRS